MRLLGVLTAVLVAAGILAAGLSTASSSVLPRATADRPDEVRGEQVHFLYVLPTNAPDEQLDVNGELTTSIARMQAWLAQQSGGPKLRIDTYQGQPDITFVRTALDPDLSTDLTIRQFVERLGFAQPNKVYVAYFGGWDAYECGIANLGGKASIVWLTCTSAFPSTAAFRLLDAVAMHEILHALGAVPECSPNSMPEGHVSDRTDIMDYRALPMDASGQVTSLLDPGRNDYWGHSLESDCADVADSRYLDSYRPAAPAIRLAAVSRIKAPRGRLLVRAGVSNVAASRVSVQCSAKLSGRRLRVLSARYAARTASCGFAVGARRGLVSGKIGVRSGRVVATRTFRLRV